ncbi:MAG: cell division protein ZapA, partial [Simplicispira sp.]|nr:cell division protein ZapA [Simplicispira sp.]
MKQLEVQIMQQSYLLSCPDGREVHLLEAVERVDTAMTRIRDAGKVRSRERIAVLAALNMAFELSDREAAELAAATAAAQAQAAATALLAAPPPPEETPGLDAQDMLRLQALVERLD